MYALNDKIVRTYFFITRAWSLVAFYSPCKNANVVVRRRLLPSSIVSLPGGSYDLWRTMLLLPGAAAVPGSDWGLREPAEIVLLDDSPLVTPSVLKLNFGVV